MPPAVAALTISERTSLSEIRSPSITADEGVWALARPGVVPGYGEVLLLDARREKVIKAFPLPHTPPYELAMTDAAVYAGRAGVGGFHTTICRIDRKTHALTKRTLELLEMDDLAADASGVWAKDFKGTWTRLDPVTLEVRETKVKRP